MKKDEFYAMVTANYKHTIKEYTNALKRGDITEEHYQELVRQAKDFWLSVTK